MPAPPVLAHDAPSQRDRYLEVADRIRALVREREPGSRPPTCFVSYAWGDEAHEAWVEDLATDLQNSGIEIMLDRRHNAAPGSSVARYVGRLLEADWVLVVGTLSYREKTDNLDPARGTVAASEADLYFQRLEGTEEEKRTVLPVLREGPDDRVFPPQLRRRVFTDLRAGAPYHAGLLDLVLTMYRVSFDSDRVAAWRRELRPAPPGDPAKSLAAEPGAPRPAAGPPEAPSRRHNLPPAGELFIGREGELREVADMLERQRLVTLTGVGGSGKSRLAEEVARRLIDRYRDGVWLTRLATVNDELLVPQSIAASLGLKEQAAAPPTDILASHLQDRQALIVLDNCEHLVEACAKVVDEVLERCPEVRVLATSRRPVRRGAGERLFEVPPLGVPPEKGWTLPELGAYDAVRLFVEVGRSLPKRQDYALRAHNAAAIAQICRQLDGIPLAIELAAVHLEHLSSDDIAKHLGRAFKLLKGGRRSDQRHRSLQATLDWSHELLGDDARLLFARLGTFAGSATRDDVMAVCGDDTLDELDLLESLERLVNHSLVLVRREGRTRRYSMHEVVRQYSRIKLEQSGEAPSLARRHRDRFLELAETVAPKLLSKEQDGALVHLEADHANLRQALHHALDGGDAAAALRLGAHLWRFWEIRTYFNEGRRWLERLLELPVEGNRALWAEVASAAATLTYRQGDLDESARRASQALALERELGNDAGVANALNDLGIIAGRQGRFEDAFELYRQSLELKRKADDDRQMGVAHFNVGNTLVRCGRAVEGRDDLRESLARFRKSGNLWECGFPLYALGIAALLENDAEKARKHFSDALEARSPSDDKRGMADALTGLGLTELRLGERRAAREPLARALELRAEVGDRPGKVETLEAIAEWALGDDAAAPAARLLAATERFRAEETLPLAPLFVPARERLVSELRRALGEEGLGAAREAAAALDLDGALELGRTLLGENLPPASA